MRTKLRRTAWIALGVVAFPAAFLGTLYLVAPIWVGIVDVVAFALAKWRALDHLITGVVLGLFPLIVVGEARQAAERTISPGDWFISRMMLWTSVAALTICAAKLGRKAGHAAWNN